MNPKQPESISEYLQEYTKLVVLDVDEKGIISHANRHALKMAGQELAGRPFKDFFVEFTQLPDLDVILGKGIQKQLLNVSGARGLPQSIYFTSMRTADGFVLIGEIDYAELEELRSNMITMNNELNNLARELQKKNVELDRLNKLKNQFLGMAAHDLRNPIGSIMSFSDFILENRGEDISPDLKKNHRHHQDIQQIYAQFT